MRLRPTRTSRPGCRRAGAGTGSSPARGDSRSHDTGAMTLPSGTVTFVFTDIEGSTRLLQELGDEYSHVVSAHRRIIRETFGERDGREMDTQGDAFFFSFARARSAVDAAVAAQRALRDEPWPHGKDVRVRMG